jgi:hypothetical protein
MAYFLKFPDILFSILQYVDPTTLIHYEMSSKANLKMKLSPSPAINKLWRHLANLHCQCYGCPQPKQQESVNFRQLFEKLVIENCYSEWYAVDYSGSFKQPTIPQSLMAPNIDAKWRLLDNLVLNRKNYSFQDVFQRLSAAIEAVGARDYSCDCPSTADCGTGCCNIYFFCCFYMCCEKMSWQDNRRVRAGQKAGQLISAELLALHRKILFDFRGGGKYVSCNVKFRYKTSLIPEYFVENQAKDALARRAYQC